MDVQNLYRACTIVQVHVTPASVYM